MKRTTRLKKYVELFKRNMGNFLAPGISIEAVIYPVEKERGRGVGLPIC